MIGALYTLLPKWALIAMLGVLGALVVAKSMDNHALASNLTTSKNEADQLRVDVADLKLGIEQANTKAATESATLTKKLLDAQNEATRLKTVHAAATVALRAERDGLRSDIAAYRAPYRLAGAKPGAGSDAADTFADLFQQCTDRYSELALTADAHVIDIKTLIAGWQSLPVGANP